MKEYNNRKKLITNGCSFTRGHFNVKGNFDSRGSWAYWLADLTDKQLCNMNDMNLSIKRTQLFEPYSNLLTDAETIHAKKV